MKTSIHLEPSLPHSHSFSHHSSLQKPYLTQLCPILSPIVAIFLERKRRIMDIGLLFWVIWIIEMLWYSPIFILTSHLCAMNFTGYRRTFALPITSWSIGLFLAPSSAFLGAEIGQGLVEDQCGCVLSQGFSRCGCRGNGAWLSWSMERLERTT